MACVCHLVPMKRVGHNDKWQMRYSGYIRINSPTALDRYSTLVVDFDFSYDQLQKIMIHVLVSTKVRSGKRKYFLEGFKANLPKVLAESGCVEYASTVDINSKLPSQILDENTVTIIEK